MDINTIAVIGGDRRSAVLCSMLSDDGYTVFSAGLPLIEGVISASPKQAAAMAQAVILPLPAFSGGNISDPLSDSPIEFDSELSDVLSNARVFGGMLPPELCAGGWYDYAQNESFLIRNARLTAEAAMAVIIEELPFSLMGRKILVTGFGRISKLMCPLLAAFGANVTVAARKDSDRAMAQMNGFEAVGFDSLSMLAGSFDAVVNTVPCQILTKPILGRLKSGCVIFDLASRPGGVESEAAETLGVRVTRAHSLPGRFSPVSAAGAIKDTVLSVLKEEAD